jgi:D-alanyl-D-alanine carboxypeptidase
MVKSATNRTYNGQLQKQVYGPLGLKKTTLPRGKNLKEPYVRAYNNDPNDHPPQDISKLIAAGWPWASGGIVSTPADLNDFIRGYVGGDLFYPRTRAHQRRFLAGGRSDPPGPGMNSAGLGIFRYETRCGATRAVSRATSRSWRLAPTAPARWSCPSTNDLPPSREPPASSPPCAPPKGAPYAPR